MFVVHNIVILCVVHNVNVLHNTKLLSFVVHDHLKKVGSSLKTSQNYIMNDINDERPFPTHEQSWCKAKLCLNYWQFFVSYVDCLSHHLIRVKKWKLAANDNHAESVCRKRALKLSPKLDSLTLHHPSRVPSSTAPESVNLSRTQLRPQIWIGCPRPPKKGDFLEYKLWVGGWPGSFSETNQIFRTWKKLSLPLGSVLLSFIL